MKQSKNTKLTTINIKGATFTVTNQQKAEIELAQQTVKEIKAKISIVTSKVRKNILVKELTTTSRELAVLSTSIVSIVPKIAIDTTLSLLRWTNTILNGISKVVKTK